MENKCKCCGEYKFNYEFEICPICGWQNDPIQNEDENFFGGANDLSLRKYKYYYNKGIKNVNEHFIKIANNFNENINFLNIEFIIDYNYVILFSYNNQEYKFEQINNNFILQNGKTTIKLDNLYDNILDNSNINIILNKAQNIRIKRKINILK